MDEMFSQAGHRPSAWRVWNILTIKDVITKEDVGRCMDRNLLHDMLAEMAGTLITKGRAIKDLNSHTVVVIVEN